MMAPHYEDDMVTLHHGDCLDVLRSLPDASVDAVVTDPPYDLTAGKKGGSGIASVNLNSPAGRARITAGFMGKAWDGTGIAFRPDVWIECLRVLKPGGHLLAFGGSRTWHRLVCAVEDAGFEVRDSIAWLYGSGFPKSLDVSKALDKVACAERMVVGTATYADGVPTRTRNGTDLGNMNDDGWQPVAVREVTAPTTDAAKQWQGWGTALKPAFEPIVVGRKPLVGTVAGNVLLHGTGALNIDACRVAHASEADLAASLAKNPGRDDTVTSEVYGAGRGQQSVNTAGRWPTNVLLGHSSECVQVGTRTETVGGGEKASGGFVEGYEPGDGFVGRPVSSPVYRCAADCQVAELDRQSGVSVSRVGTPRGAASGHGWGMTDTGAEYDDQGGASRFFPTFRYEAKAPTVERPRDGDVAHPTVKPLDLMRWLVRLVTPRGGVVLEPFAGSGTTAEACVIEGFRCLAIEREATYLPLIVARLSKPIQPDLFGGAA